MGTDNLHHRRKAKNAKQLGRRGIQRDPYAKVLIVCEGGKTEPCYFNDIKDYYSLNSANVEICGECGTDPLSILKYGKKRYGEEKKAGDAFDKVYCVFDRDAHPNYNQAMNDIRSSTPQETFIAITSVPCFEYWLLLHYTYTTRPYMAASNKSVCKQVETELKEHMPSYTKGQEGIFSALFDRLNNANKHAQRALQEADRNNTDNPSTHVYKLVAFLQNIRK
nr:RloB family protein [Nitrosomonas nitrosa]